MKINLWLLRIYLAKIYPRYNLASIIKFLVHHHGTVHTLKDAIWIGILKLVPESCDISGKQKNGKKFKKISCVKQSKRNVLKKYRKLLKKKKKDPN